MKRSILRKILAGYVAVIILLSLLFLIIAPYVIRPYFAKKITDDLTRLCIVLETHLRQMPDTDQAELDRQVKELGTAIDTRITIISLNGVVIADSEKDPFTMENHKNRPEVLIAAEGGTGTDLRYSRTVGEDMLYVAIPRLHNGTVTGVVRVSVFVKDIDRVLGRLKNNIYSVSLIMIVLALIIAVLFSKTLSDRIRTLAASAGRIAEGDFDTRVELGGRDELCDLGNSFNGMAEQIQELFNEQTIQKEELARIIANIQEAMLVINDAREITLSNQSAEQVFEHGALTGCLYTDVIKDEAFLHLLADLLKGDTSTSCEVEFNNRHYLCSTTPLPVKHEVIVLLHDITEIKAIQKLKKDFVANVSHELRTPLTAIKGYVETLMSEADDSNRRYAEIIQRHTDRLVNIVSDLLVLSSLEEKGFTLDKEPVDLATMIDEVIKMFAAGCEAKGLRLTGSCSAEVSAVQADPIKLEQVLVNLVENAVRYTEEGEISLTVRLTESNMVEISVQDTGLGIPLKYQERIFERFFVVDKSRSREMGGTGLGLSIVKHIIQLHGGVMGVESTAGKGSVFKLYLPLN